MVIDGIRNGEKILISRSNFDAFGFDVLAQIQNQEDPIQIQLKSFNGKANYWDIHKSLLKNPNGRVVAIEIKQMNNDLTFIYYGIQHEKINEILNRNPIKPHPKKCKLKKGDLTEIDKTELINKLLKSTHISMLSNQPKKATSIPQDGFKFKHRVSTTGFLSPFFRTNSLVNSLTSHTSPRYRVETYCFQESDCRL